LGQLEAVPRSIGEIFKEKQGDQIGLIFAYFAIAYFGQFSLKTEIYQILGFFFHG
jgi:hypothetical protein